MEAPAAEMGAGAAAGGPRVRGQVKWFNPAKGFGFITPDSGGEELFVHQSSIQADGFRSLGEGEAVEFDIETGPDGRAKAVNVTGPGGDAPQGAPKRFAMRRAPMGPMQGGPMQGRGGPYAYADPAAFGYAGYYVAPGFYFPQGGRGGFAPGRGGGRGGGRSYVGTVAPPGGPGGLGGPGGPGGLGGQPPGAPSGLQVVVHNLPWTCTWQQLKDAFRDWKVERADIVYDNWGRSRGFGVVRFAAREDADAACEQLNNTQIDGRTISVRTDRFA